MKDHEQISKERKGVYVIPQHSCLNSSDFLILTASMLPFINQDAQFLQFLSLNFFTTASY
jgi:hypothetical protein